jgi:hypothetical protein
MNILAYKLDLKREYLFKFTVSISHPFLIPSNFNHQFFNFFFFCLNKLFIPYAPLFSEIRTKIDD